MDSAIVFGVLLSLLAGLATAIGAGIALVVPRFSDRWLAILLGFAAGVMIAIAFIELFEEAVAGIGLVRASLAFFTGFGIIFLIDVLVPHEYETERIAGNGVEDGRLKRTGTFTAVGVAIHNFPEGLLVVTGAAASPELGILLAVAVAIHNIPEGIAVAVPIAAGTGRRRLAFAYAFVSGLAEPVGALLGGLVLMHFMTETVLMTVLAGVAGFMVFISLDELLPAANLSDEEHAPTLGVFAGMIVMVATLVVLG